MWMYLVVLLAAFLVDLVPVFGPPAWTVMVFLQVKFDLNIWWVLVCGVIGSTLGRYTMSIYIPKVSDKIIKRQKNEDMEFLGKKLAQERWRCWLFVLIYTLIPVPSTPLFTAAGLARIKPVYVIPPFFIGKFASDAVMVISGNYIANHASDFMDNLLSWKSILSFAAGLIILAAVLFIDWWTLLKKKKVRLNFRIWK